MAIGHWFKGFTKWYFDSDDEGGGGGAWTVLTEETVTTEFDADAAYGDLSYSQLIDAESIKVTFNGTVYECEGVEEDHGCTYGASYDENLSTWDWSEYPFQISSHETPFGIKNHFVTQTAGTYTVKIEVPA